jgi:hypothetical protein
LDEQKAAQRVGNLADSLVGNLADEMVGTKECRLVVDWAVHSVLLRVVTMVEHLGVHSAAYWVVHWEKRMAVNLVDEKVDEKVAKWELVMESKDRNWPHLQPTFGEK